MAHTAPYPPSGVTAIDDAMYKATDALNLACENLYEAQLSGAPEVRLSVLRAWVRKLTREADECAEAVLRARMK